MQFGMMRAHLVTILAGALALACGSGGTGGASLRPFAVSTTSPEEGEVVESRSPVLFVVFSRPLAEQTMRGRDVTLISQFGDRIDGDVRVRPLTPTMISFVPRSALKGGTDYTLHIDSAELRDESGNALDGPFELRFGIAGDPPTAPPSGGGGGGGGGIPGAAGSVIYAGSCESLTGCPGSNFEFDPDGGSSGIAYDGWSGPMGSNPSPRLHKGARVFLKIQEAGGTMPDGKTSRTLSAVIPSRGKSVPILGHTSTEYMSAGQWALDESFISYFHEEWAKGATSTIYKVPVSWDSDGVPSFGSPSKVLQFSGTMPVGSGHAWAPNGDDLIYAIGTTEIRLLIGGTSTVLAQGSNLVRIHWMPDGLRVLYGEWSSRTIHIVDTDGTNPTTLTLPPNGPSAISVSPDGTEIALALERPTGGRGLFVLDIASGVTREVTNPGQTVVRPFGWRSLAEYR